MKIERQEDAVAAGTRSQILDATEQIMIEEGYAGVTSRRVAARAGLKSNLMHYHFRTMDDLFIAAFHRLEDRYDERFARAAAAPRPLRALWALGQDAASAKLILEFNALASHRPLVRELIARSARRDRINTAAVLEMLFERYGVDRELYPPKVVAILFAGISRVLSTERALGTDDGHDEALVFVSRLLDGIEGKASRRRPRPGGKTAAEPTES